MKEQDLKELLELEKRFYQKLSETIDITREILDNADRQDHYSIQMLVSMRQTPILELQEVQSHIALKRVEFTPEDAADFDRLLEGGDARSPAEVPVAGQIAANHRLLQQLVELDQVVSKKVCGENSFYRTE